MSCVDANSSTSSSLLTEFGNNVSHEAKEEGKIVLQLLQRLFRDCKCALDRIKIVTLLLILMLITIKI